MDESPGQPTNVVIVDDHASFTEALGMALEREPDIVCAASAATVDEALRIISETRPDVVLMDVHLPDGNGIDATARIKSELPGTRVIVLTGESDPAFMANAAAAGASGFLVKTSPIAEVVKAIRTAGEGGMVIDPSTLGDVLRRVRTRETSDAQDVRLTTRESEVLAKLGTGLDPRSIAKELGISIHTCRGYVKTLFQKLGVHSQLEAVVTASRMGLLP